MSESRDCHRCVTEPHGHNLTRSLRSRKRGEEVLHHPHFKAVLLRVEGDLSAIRVDTQTPHPTPCKTDRLGFTATGWDTQHFVHWNSPGITRPGNQDMFAVGCPFNEGRLDSLGPQGPIQFTSLSAVSRHDFDRSNTRLIIRVDESQLAAAR